MYRLTHSYAWWYQDEQKRLLDREREKRNQYVAAEEMLHREAVCLSACLLVCLLVCLSLCLLTR